jgi:hypothetical protein
MWDIEITHFRGGNVINDNYMRGTWQDTATNLTQITFLGSVANMFSAGCNVKLIALGV